MRILEIVLFAIIALFALMFVQVGVVELTLWSVVAVSVAGVVVAKK